MPRFTTEFHKLPETCKEIPLVEDCYLVKIEDASGNTSGDGLFPVPWPARRVVPLVDAWNIEVWEKPEEALEEWMEQWGWDGEPKHANTRLDFNSETVFHPIKMTFQWGEGHPKVDGVEMLPHEEGEYGHYCQHCGKEFYGKPEDCPVLRLRAMADAVLEARAGTHVQAVGIFHRENLE